MMEQRTTRNKLIITRFQGRLLTAVFDDKRAVELSLEEEGSVLGNIYIGKVMTIVKNLNSAFVDFESGRTGYYSLSDNPRSLFADGHLGSIKTGDEILVQVEKDAVKTKDPVLTGNLNFTGKYAVITAGKPRIGFSSKITDRQWKETVRSRLEALVGTEIGVIVRTNAYKQEEALLEEVSLLLSRYRSVLEMAGYRTCYSLLYEAEPGYLRLLRGFRDGFLSEIITDEQDVFEGLRKHFQAQASPYADMLRFYQDSMLSLTRLYALETVMEQACQKRVWLKSGGYLVIEQTEAMVVIDVNTGKYSGHKRLEDTFRLINLEAAAEICRQLRLRNLSGIIIIDFIDMKAEEDKQALMSELKSLAAKDPVKTTVVDMTALNLVEMTRRKEKKPLSEQLFGLL